MTGDEVRQLLAALHDSDNDVNRRRAFEQLRGQGPALVPLLVKVLGSRDARMREQAARALGWLGKDAEPAVPLLGTLFLAPDQPDAVRDAACISLGQLGASATPCLVQALLQGNAFVRRKAMSALEWMKPRPVEAIDPLIASLDDLDADLRSSTVRCLVTFGPLAVPALTAALAAASARVRVYAADALLHQEPWYDAPSRSPPPRDCYPRPDDLRPTARAALAALAAGLHDPNGSVRARAIRALEQAAPYSRPAGPLVLQALKDEDEKVREAAAGAVAKIDPSLPGLVPALIDAVRDPSDGVRFWAMSALGDLRAATAVPALITFIRSGPERSWVGGLDVAAEVLGSLGAAAASALPALREALGRTRSSETRECLVKAIRKIKQAGGDSNGEP